VAKVVSIKKRRDTLRAPESDELLKVLSQPSQARALDEVLDWHLNKLHENEVRGLKDRSVGEFWGQAAKSKKQPVKPPPSTTTTIDEAEFLRIVGRADKSKAANSVWILRRIRHAAAQGDSSLFPAYKQMGRQRLYHLDSVMAWLARHPLDQDD